MRNPMIFLMILAAGITGCRSDSTTATPLRECEVVSFASPHGRELFLVERWEPVDISEVGTTREEVNSKLGSPVPVGDAPPDEDGGWYREYGTSQGLYRVHYSGFSARVTKAFKAVLESDEISEQSDGAVTQESAPSAAP